MTATVWTPIGVALGANLGDPLQQLGAARLLLQALPNTRGWRFSTVIQTTPVGCSQPQADYHNQVAIAEATASPECLHAAFQAIEAQLGRRRQAGERNQPRTLDLDFLFYGEQRIETPSLTLPHPRLHLRPFVILPLAELYAHAES